MNHEEALKIARLVVHVSVWASEGCDCALCLRTAAAILKAHQDADTAARKACAEILKQCRKSFEEHRCGFGSCHCCVSMAAIDKFLSTIKEPR